MVKVGHIMIGGRGKGGILWPSKVADIRYFCERTGRIFREDIKVCKMYIHTDFCSDPEKMISWFTHVQFSILSDWLKRKWKTILFYSTNNIFYCRHIIYNLKSSYFMCPTFVNSYLNTFSHFNPTFKKISSPPPSNISSSSLSSSSLSSSSP